MSAKAKRSKPAQAAAVGALALCILASGAFAWNNFAQQKLNRFSELLQPGVNLHDDFAGGPEKHVYAENNGSTPALVRLRISEYLQFQNGDTYPALAADDPAGTGWHPHASLQNCGFVGHDYYDWQFGGHKAYMPAAPSAQAQGAFSDLENYIEPRDVGDLDAIIDYAAALRAAFQAQSNAQALQDLEKYLAGSEENTARLQNAISTLPERYTQAGVKQYEGQPEAELTRRLNEVRLTLVPKPIISMEDWAAGATYGEPCALGPFWVLDGDGWAYWAQPLEPGQATGQLLQSVTYKGAAPDTMTYKLRVGLNAVSADGPSLNQFLSLAGAEGGVSESGAKLLLLASGSYAAGGDGELYLDQGNNTFALVIKNNGSYINYTLGDLLCGGPDAKPGTADDLAPGSSFSLTTDGKLAAAGAGAADYTVRSVVTGANGVGYLELDETGLYLGSTDAEGGLAALGQGAGYRFYTAGADGYLGTADDPAANALWAQLNGRWYQQMRDNTWLLVEGPGSDTAVDAGGAALTDPADYIYICAGADQNLSTEADNKEVVVGADGGRWLKATLQDSGETLTYYLRAGTDGLLGVEPDETRWPGPDGLIGTADDSDNRPVKAPAVGSTVTFGNYPQLQKAATPKQPIQWYVLKTEGSKALLLSRYALYPGTLQTSTAANGYKEWRDAPARTFLNGTFINTAFTAAEQKQLVLTTVSTPYMVDTQDKVFIPTSAEMNSKQAGVYSQYINTTNTVYSQQNGLQTKIGQRTLVNPYHLRDHNGIGNAYCIESGAVTAAGGSLSLGLRPMIWVDYAA